MLRVKIELVPGGVEAGTQLLDEIFIGNDGTGSICGNYDVYTQDPRGKPKPRDTRPGWIGRVEDVQREPDQGHRYTVIRGALERLELSA
jgi:hypothetical protein